MNFFQHQDQARKKTGLLVLMLCCAVLFLILVTIFVVGTFLYFLKTNSSSVEVAQNYGQSFSDHFTQLIHSPITLWIALGVLFVVSVGSLHKFFQLSQGGKVIAQSLGGRKLSPDSREPMERKVLNIVEEMAIASGNPVPAVYLLEEESINAFAAGHNRRDAVIGVTKGCVDLLTRDELQGVIAHEFSHIHNGDMRLNMRLIAILHGILVIGLIGLFVIRGSGSRYGRRASYSVNKGKNQGKQFALGMALVAIGYGGTFFGNIIKAAISRQREFLADASAVQFTRNPEGISGALKKIGGWTAGSTLSSGNASEYSHLFFGQGVILSFARMMATHPPLTDRVKRIEPRWNKQFPIVEGNTIADSGSNDQTHSGMASSFTETPPTQSSQTIPSDMAEHVAEPKAETLEHAEKILASIPTTLLNHARDPFSARAVIYALLLEKESKARETQLEKLKKSAHPMTFKMLEIVLPLTDKLSRDSFLPLVSLSIPALKNQSNTQYEVFKKNLSALITADKSISLFEWSLYKICTQNIEGKETSGTRSINSSKKEITYLLKILSLCGKNNYPINATNAGITALGWQAIESLPSTQTSYSALDKTLKRLAELKPLEKPKLLKALIECINHDGKVTIEEKELFRVVADTLDCPMPPLT